MTVVLDELVLGSPEIAARAQVERESVDAVIEEAIDGEFGVKVTNLLGLMDGFDPESATFEQEQAILRAVGEATQSMMSYSNRGSYYRPGLAWEARTDKKIGAVGNCVGRALLQAGWLRKIGYRYSYHMDGGHTEVGLFSEAEKPWLHDIDLQHDFAVQGKMLFEPKPLGGSSLDEPVLLSTRTEDRSRTDGTMRGEVFFRQWHSNMHLVGGTDDPKTPTVGRHAMFTGPMADYMPVAIADAYRYASTGRIDEMLALVVELGPMLPRLPWTHEKLRDASNFSHDFLSRWHNKGFEVASTFLDVFYYGSDQWVDDTGLAPLLHEKYVQ